MAIVCAYSAPSEPNSVMAVNSSSMSITVSWTAPSMPNGMIRGYTVTYSEIGMSDMTQRNVTSDTTTTELSGLEIYQEYAIFVQAITIVIGERSNSVTVRTSESSKSIFIAKLGPGALNHIVYTTLAKMLHCCYSHIHV